LSEIYVFRSAESYLLITNRPSREEDRKFRSTAVQGGLKTVQVNGNIHAFSRASGKPLWAVPARVQQRGMIVPQPPDLPLLAFVNVQEKSGPNATSVLCIDKRTGREVYRDDDLKFETNYCQISSEPAENKITLSVQTTQTKTIELTITNDPLPPEPTVQEGGDHADVKPKESAAAGILRSLGRSLRRAVGIPDERDPLHGQSDDLFGDLDDEIEIDAEAADEDK
jgi:hypothetical protein